MGFYKVLQDSAGFEGVSETYGSGTVSCKSVKRRLAMNRDEIDGKAEQLKGKVKQATGDLTDDERLHDEGVVDEAAGKVQEGFGKGRRKLGEAIEDIGENVKS
jgi:uncharacterized protein YjbJ (UPF0337 family)